MYSKNKKEIVSFLLTNETEVFMKTLTKTTLFALSAVVALGASNNSADAQVVYVVRPHHHVVVPAYRVAPYGTVMDLIITDLFLLAQ